MKELKGKVHLAHFDAVNIAKQDMDVKSYHFTGPACYCSPNPVD
ncbi:MAG: hypothetical protein U0W24_09530 [Bacteroidales bacterium]